MLGIIISCTQSQKEETQEKKSQIEGAWELVYFKWTNSDSTFGEYPGNVTECNSSWILSGNNSLYYYQYKTHTDSVYKIAFGDVNYKYDGELYEETYLSSSNDERIGKTIQYNVVIRNDSLTLSGQGPDGPGYKVLEKYVRK